MQIRNWEINGQAITNGLRNFNEWRDDFLIELSTLLLMIGFVAGTVDVFTKGGLSTNWLFNMSWAIVQAVAIDGLFFAVWGRIARLQWSWPNTFNNVMLIIVGLLLAIVATLVNGILSYQELMNVANVKDAMATLGVDQSAFTYARSILVVIVSILVALFCRSKKAPPEPVQPAVQAQSQAQPVGVAQAIEQKPTVRRSPTRRVSEATNPQVKAIPQQAASIAHGLGDVARSSEGEATAQDGSQQHGYVAMDDGATVAIANGEGATMIATGSHRDRIKQAMLKAMSDGLEMTYGDIAEAAGVGYSTVKKYAPIIREELATVNA